MGRHHVTMWLAERGFRTTDSDPDSLLITMCKSVPVEVNVKVVNSEQMHYKCKKARIRLTKEAAEQLVKKKESSSVSADSSVIQNSSNSDVQGTPPMQTGSKDLNETESSDTTPSGVSSLDSAQNPNLTLETSRDISEEPQTALDESENVHSEDNPRETEEILLAARNSNTTLDTSKFYYSTNVFCNTDVEVF